jgi:HAD superfamily hydrolase (TIGR01509 family)
MGSVQVSQQVKFRLNAVLRTELKQSNYLLNVKTPPNHRNSSSAQRPGAGFAVIFDVDGTMVDNAPFHQAAWIELGRRRGKPITAEYYRSHIHARSNELTVRALFGDDCSAEFVAEVSAEKEQLYRDLYAPEIHEVPGLTRLLEALRSRGIPCAAASNSPEANVSMVLDLLQIRSFFRVVIDRDQVTRGKPHPDLLLAAARGLGFPPQKCLVLEDSAPGFAAARHARMPYVVITAGACREELSEATDAISVHADFTSVDPDGLIDLMSARD